MRYTIRTAGGSRIVINTSSLSEALIKYGTGPIDDAAADGAEVAKSAAGSQGRYIRHKTVVDFDLESGSPRSNLTKHLRVPVGLIVNDSMWAQAYEYGRVTRNSENKFRAIRGRQPLGKALQAIANLPGWRKTGRRGR